MDVGFLDVVLDFLVIYGYRIKKRALDKKQKLTDIGLQIFIWMLDWALSVDIGL